MKHTALCLPSTCVRSTDGSAETTDVASLFDYWCFQTSAAARGARFVTDFGRASDAKSFNFPLSAQLAATFVDVWSGVGEVNTLACAHDQSRGEIDTSHSDCPWSQVDFTPRQRNCWLQWRQFRRCLFWITLILCLKVKMAKSSPTARLVVQGSRRNGASRPTS